MPRRVVTSVPTPTSAESAPEGAVIWSNRPLHEVTGRTLKTLVGIAFVRPSITTATAGGRRSPMQTSTVGVVTVIAPLATRWVPVISRRRPNPTAERALAGATTAGRHLPRPRPVV